MSTKKKRFKWGGARPGAGRPPGETKIKICVSVDSETWQSAVNQWKDKGSRLVDRLILAYIKDRSIIARLEAS
jgi:hypothetical protein